MHNTPPPTNARKNDAETRQNPQHRTADSTINNHTRTRSAEGRQNPQPTSTHSPNHNQTNNINSRTATEQPQHTNNTRSTQDEPTTNNIKHIKTTRQNPLAHDTATNDEHKNRTKETPGTSTTTKEAGNIKNTSPTDTDNFSKPWPTTMDQTKITNPIDATGRNPLNNNTASTENDDHDIKGYGVRTRSHHIKDIKTNTESTTPMTPPTQEPPQHHRHNTDTLENLPLPFMMTAHNLQKLTLHNHDYPLPNSTQWKAAGEWSNIDIDEVTRQWQAVDPTVFVMHAMFLLDAQRNPQAAMQQLKMAEEAVGKEGKIHIVCWIRHHWVAATINKEAVEIADSSPGIATGDDLRTIAEFIGEALGRRFQLRELRTPRQPRQSTECGAHCIVNMILNHSGWLFPREQGDKKQTTLSYAGLQESLNLFAAGELRLGFIQERILETMGEALYHLLQHERLLQMADAWPDEPIRIRWMAEDGMQTWQGRLHKRHPTHWSIKYDQLETMGFLPHSQVCYLTAERINQVDATNWTADLQSLNVRTPPSTAKMEGDNTTIKRMKDILNGPRTLMPYNSYFTAATASTTRTHHVQILNTLKTMPTTLDNMSISQGIPLFIHSMQHQRKWKATTTLTKLASIQGMLKNLPYYITNAPSIQMNGSTIWRTTMKGATYNANAETPAQAEPMTTEHLYQLINNSTDMEMKACLELSWLTAGRIGDILQLTPKSIAVLDDEVTMVKFTHGKTARLGAYTIAIPPITPTTKEYLPQARNNLCLFPTITTTSFRDEVRKINTQYECRSIRRGRLQVLSQGGMSEEALLHISRHLNIASLRRYLDFGQRSGENLHRARIAAKASALASQQMRRHWNSSNQMAGGDARPPRTSRGHSPPWLGGEELLGPSSQSRSESASGG